MHNPPHPGEIIRELCLDYLWQAEKKRSSLKVRGLTAA